jgi:Protein of unknown function, DUF547
MTKPRATSIFIAILFFVFAFDAVTSQLNAQQSSSKSFDHSEYNALLMKHVNSKGLVNYQGFKSSATFKNYIKALATADISSFSKNEKLAFYINAYNALVIRQVIDNLPISSPMDVKGFFTDKKFTVARKKLSLNTLEKKRIIPLGGSLVHFAVVCAAKSCPKLLPKAYTSANVSKLLKDNARAFVNDKASNKLDKKANILHLSKIFEWYEDDFKNEYASLISFIRAFITATDSAYLNNKRVSIKYIAYDWKLNSQ